ncbi:MAG: hypothetical protein RQ763_10720, partial [Sulfurimonas sp.]|uniref:hypothetical protein n=1 Tax=Sulfurimonas sp. TaxID=2022749 RepID=UPI0028CF74F4
SSKLLTSWQKKPRENFIFIQSMVLFMISAIALFVMDELKKISYIDNILITFAVFCFLLLFVSRKKIKIKEQKIIHAGIESTFAFKPVERNLKGKSIDKFSHYFSGFKIKRSQKDFSVRDISSNFTAVQVKDYIAEQKQTQFKLNNFYRELINFINSKADLLGFEKLNINTLSTYNLLKAKVRIFRAFQNLTDKKYYASISQLSQIATPDEMRFLSFLRDSQHEKYCNISVLHALAFIKIKVL